MNCTIDASVFVSATHTNELQHLVSLDFLEQVRIQGISIFCPTLVLPECMAAITRPTGDTALAAHLMRMIENIPGLNLAPLTSSLAHRAAKIAMTQRLRGADSVYVAAAEEFDAILVTWDTEMLKRGAAIVQTITPALWLAQAQDNDQEAG
ncbi:MAG: type II toxin-antitoxin system VapC family toxin [Deltaproteobacteria bacterium]|nr:type II toxin-antitoxin system VapC family toxin [Deltaproteobacteria bacterium]